jgi:hypothetical protein
VRDGGTGVSVLSGGSGEWRRRRAERTGRDIVELAGDVEGELIEWWDIQCLSSR